METIGHNYIYNIIIYIYIEYMIYIYIYLYYFILLYEYWIYMILLYIYTLYIRYYLIYHIINDNTKDAICKITYPQDLGI